VALYVGRDSGSYMKGTVDEVRIHSFVRWLVGWLVGSFVHSRSVVLRYRKGQPVFTDCHYTS